MRGDDNLVKIYKAEEDSNVAGSYTLLDIKEPDSTQQQIQEILQEVLAYKVLENGEFVDMSKINFTPKKSYWWKNSNHSNRISKDINGVSDRVRMLFVALGKEFMKVGLYAEVFLSDSSTKNYHLNLSQYLLRQNLYDANKINQLQQNNIKKPSYNCMMLYNKQLELVAQINLRALKWGIQKRNDCFYFSGVENNMDIINALKKT